MRRALSDREYCEARIRKTEGGCWTWTGHREKGGYGIFIRGSGSARRQLRAHRVVYELLVEPIPEGHEIHHSCSNPTCVNPAHLEPVTHAANMAAIPRKTHCKQGHEYTPENTYFFPNGRSYYCKACKNDRAASERALLV